MNSIKKGCNVDFSYFQSILYIAMLHFLQDSAPDMDYHESFDFRHKEHRTSLFDTVVRQGRENISSRSMGKIFFFIVRVESTICYPSNCPHWMRLSRGDVYKRRETTWLLDYRGMVIHKENWEMSPSLWKYMMTSSLTFCEGNWTSPVDSPH